MSKIDDFMSQVIDLDETEKEEVIRVLASLFCSEPKVIRDTPSKNVMLVLIPFMSNIMMENLKKTVEKKDLRK